MPRAVGRHRPARDRVQRSSQGSDRGEIARRLERTPPLKELIDEPGMQIRRAELRVLQNLPEEREVGSYAADVVLAECANHAGGGLLARGGPYASLASSGSYSIGTFQPA